MGKELARKSESEMRINPSLDISKDEGPSLTLPEDYVPKTLRAYWDSPVHRAQTELIVRMFAVNLS